MDVDTGAFQALTGQVTDLAERVRELAVRDVALEHMFGAGFAAGEAAARKAILGRAAEASRTHVRLRGARPAHLRVIREGAS